MQRVLVTGGTGFIGSCLVRRLLADGHDVHLIARPGHTPWRLTDIAADVHLHAADLDDGVTLRSALKLARADWIFHLAVHGAYPHQTNAHAMVRINIEGTRALLEEAVRQGFGVFVNAGSSSEYGVHTRPAREDDPVDPNSVYAVTKLAATGLCRQIARATGTAVRTLRLYSIYGPFEDPGRLFPRLLMAARDNCLPPLAHPTTARDFVYVDDAVEAFVAAANARVEEPGAIFNICSGVQTTLDDLVRTCRDEFQFAAAPRWGTLPPRAWDTGTWVGDPRKAAERLGWTAKTDVRTGARAFFDWLGEREDLIERYREPSGGETRST